MAFASYQDNFKNALPSSDDFEYTIASGQNCEFAANHPLTNAMTRNLGEFARVNHNDPGDDNGPTMKITIESKKALLATDVHLMPLVIGVLGHTISVPGNVYVRWTYRNGTPTTKFKNHTVYAPTKENFNNEFYVLRERISDVPYKVEIIMTQEAEFSSFDVGRIWVGALYDLDNPENSDPGLILNGWKFGAIEGADAILSEGNQSYTNGLEPLRTLDFQLQTPNTGPLDDWLALLGDNGESGLPGSSPFGGVPLDNSTSMLGFNYHLQSGGACIVCPKEMPYVGSSHDLNKVFFRRLGIYGETASSTNEITNGTGTQFTVRYKLRQLQ